MLTQSARRAIDELLVTREEGRYTRGLFSPAQLEEIGEALEQFAAWLRGILTNTLAMHIRRYLGTEKRDPRLEQNLNQSIASATGFLQAQLAADVTSPSQHFARNEVFLQLAAALETLPPDYRQVIVLRHVEGLPFAEVARLMDRSVNSVEKLWVRSLAKLKTTMGEV